MKEKQITFVINELKKKGFVSRNTCLSKSITRLGSIISRLKADGWEFDEVESRTGKTMLQGHYVENKFGIDYQYELVSMPK